MLNDNAAETAWLLKEKHHGQKTESFLTDLKRLKAGEPLAYIIGHIPFLGATISLNSKPLIPRPETEFWVEKVSQEINKISLHPVKILDLCAGSGCIGIAIAKSIPQALVDFIEMDECHIETIKNNCLQNEISAARVRVFQGDLLTTNPDIEIGKYDFIVSNPPYIDPVLDRTQTSVTAFEPSLALYGGKDGLELIKRIINEAPQYLNSGGQLWLEHEPEQVIAINELAQKRFKIVNHLDQYQTLRFTQLMLQ